MLEGDIDRALKLTTTYYPHVLDDNPGIDFRLRCRKFVEMMRLSHEPPTKPRHGAPNEHSTSDEIFDQEMELDEPSDTPDDWDRMDTEDGRGNGVVTGDRMRETMDYGTVLMQQYKDDRTKDQALKEIFSLFAYQDLKNSPAAPILEMSGRVPVAEELNSAILGEPLFVCGVYSRTKLYQSRSESPRPPPSRRSIVRPRSSSTTTSATKEAPAPLSTSSTISGSSLSIAFPHTFVSTDP